MERLRAQLLVAAPTLLDPNFHRTVVLVTEHNDEGAMGLVLNRPTEAEVADAVPDLTVLVEPEAVVFEGGPVQPTAGLVLAEFEDRAAAAIVLGDVGLLTDTEDLDGVAAVTRRARVYAGYAGWGPGQLERELEREDWIVEPARPEDVFTEDPDSLWSAVLTRKGGTYALLATMPPDPRLN